MTGALVWVAAAAAGGAGAVARFAVERAVSARTGRAFPAGTLVVNLSGSLLLGLLAGLALRGDALLVAGTALLGSYTTFSTWMLETDRLAGERRPAAAAVNVVASLVLGVAAVALGRWLGGG